MRLADIYDPPALFVVELALESSPLSAARFCLTEYHRSIVAYFQNPITE